MTIATKGAIGAYVCDLLATPEKVLAVMDAKKG
jgi:hypothetical protein